MGEGLPGRLGGILEGLYPAVEADLHLLEGGIAVAYALDFPAQVLQRGNNGEHLPLLFRREAGRAFAALQRSPLGLHLLFQEGGGGHLPAGEGGAEALEYVHQGEKRPLVLHDGAQFPDDGVQNQPQKGQALVKFGRLGPILDGLPGLPGQNAVHLVVAAVLVEEVIVDGEILGHRGVLQVLPHKLFIHGEAVGLIELDHLAQVVPAPGGYKALSVYRGLDFIKIGLFDLQIREDDGVDALLIGVFLPHIEVGLHIDALEPVPGDDVELPHRVVVLRGIAGRHDDSSRREPGDGRRSCTAGNWSITGASVSDTQLISSRKRMPSRTPVSSIRS